MSVTYRIGDTRDLVRELPDGSVSLVACSPPFIALRSYLPVGHPLKDAEIGSEPDPATFVDVLLELTAEWGRALAPWGSIAIELGDTYSGSGGGGGDYMEGGLRSHQPGFGGSAKAAREGNAAHWRAKHQPGAIWPRAKSLALVPQAYALSLAYGRNVLRSPMTASQLLHWVDALRASGLSAEAALAMAGGWVAEHGDTPSPAGRWLVRNVITWHRPNPAVGNLGDKYRPSTSQIVVATRSPKRWFDLTAVRGERSPNTHARTAKGVNARQTTGFRTLATLHQTTGAPPLDCWTDEWDGTHETWTITTQPSPLAHYAMWPAKLAERLILSMCPAEVCTACSEPRRRIERTTNAVGKARAKDDCLPTTAAPRRAEVATLGWTDCGCDVGWTPGVVLDPFAGTGTTLAVADLHGRDAIGFDIDERNQALYEPRRAEVSRNLYGTRAELPGQLSLIGETA